MVLTDGAKPWGIGEIMIIAKKFTVPDDCPSDCVGKDEPFYQGCLCTRCPVFCCKEPVTEEDKYYMPLVPADEFREDWAEEWEHFFKTGEEPKLYLLTPEQRKKQENE